MYTNTSPKVDEEMDEYDGNLGGNRPNCTVQMVISTIRGGGNREK